MKDVLCDGCDRLFRDGELETRFYRQGKKNTRGHFCPLCCATQPGLRGRVPKIQEANSTRQLLTRAMVRTENCARCKQYGSVAVFDNSTGHIVKVNASTNRADTVFRLHDFTPLCVECVEEVKQQARKNPLFTLYEHPTLLVMLSQHPQWPRYRRMLRTAARMLADQQPPLGEPTEAAPGTVERMEVFRNRVAAGLAVFHPEDDDGIPRLRPTGDNANQWSAVPKPLPEHAYQWRVAW